MMRGKPASSMQKTYDDVYLVCSTAIYFENQNNEAEALRSWKNALDQIYYHNAYRIPANYRPKSETEKALQESLKELELQCKERVDLLEALKKSRLEADDAKKSGASEGKNAYALMQTGGPASNGDNAQRTSGWLGEGTIPPVGYPQLARPPSLPQRPLLTSKVSGIEASRSQSYPQIAPTPNLSQPGASSTEPVTKKSRTPSPNKKTGMLKTLRTGGREGARPASSSSRTTMRNRPPEAAKAATQAWVAPTGLPGSSDSLLAATARLSVSAASSSLALQGRPSFEESSRSPLEKVRSKDSVNRSAENLSGIPTSKGAQQGLQAAMPETELPKAKSYSKPEPLSYRKEYRRVIDPHTRRLIPEALNQRRQPGDEEETSEHSQPSPQGSKPKIKRKAVAGQKLSKSAKSAELSEDETTSPDSARPHRAPRRKKQSAAGGAAAELTPSSDSESNEGASEAESSTSPASKEWRARVARVLKRLPKGVDAAAAQQILNEIVIHGDEVHWGDIAGLDTAKAALKETVVYPFLRPDLFMGLREPARGMLLFGPPGTGKTMLARAVATESRSTFFAISASSLTSKYLGESEKLVRALFALAKALAPSIIFVDEIDSLLSARAGGGGEHEATRRIKTEFLIQWSDLQKAAAGRETSEREKEKGDASRVLVLAATNLPWAIDEAARRRFVRRQYIPLPEDHVRATQLRTLLSHQKHSLDDGDIEVLVELTGGFSGSDITALAKDAAMGPLRSLGEKLLHMSMDEIRPMSFDDFEASLVSIRPSVSRQGLKQYEDWAREFGERGG